MSDERINYARSLHDANTNWHFHILSPDCQLNDTNQYVLVIENTSKGEAKEFTSKEKPLDIGEPLVKLLHGDDAASIEEGDSAPSPQVQDILRRAEVLSAQGKFWHHHMLFPDCKYNESGKWLIMFEDMESGEVLKKTYDNEPKADLKHIEHLFYQQS